MAELVTIAARNFPADTAILADLRRFVTGAMQSLGLNPETMRTIELAVDEAAANVIEHAANIFPCQIGFACSESQDHSMVICEISWESNAPFQPNEPKSEEIMNRIASGVPGGLGLYLMHHLVDEIEFDYHNGICAVRLKKRV